ncbi:MAG: hypothetical protein K2H26_03375 [Ruminococcus sp.]|nr:hypothetical protein [Ruminococcus sp.]
MNLNGNYIDAIMDTLIEIDNFLKTTGKFNCLKSCADGTSRITYLINKYYVTLWYDANNYPYSIEIHLKKHSTLAGKIFDSEIIAGSEPFDKIPF